MKGYRVSGKGRRATSIKRSALPRIGGFTKRKRVSYKKKGNFVEQSFTVLSQQLTITNGDTINASYSPSLSNIESGDLTAYTSLYDEFRIKSITVDIQSLDTVNTDSTTFPFRIYSVIDKTDSNEITVAEAMQYNNVQKRRSTDKHPVYRTWVPSPSIVLQDVNGTHFIQQQRPQWMQLADQEVFSTATSGITVAQLGLKVISEPNQGAEAQLFDVYITYRVQFKVKN